MRWRETLPRPWRARRGRREEQTRQQASPPEQTAAEEPASDGTGLPGHRPDPDAAMYAEMAAMAARAAERAREEKDESIRVGMMAPVSRLRYRRMRWEAINAVRLNGLSPERIEEEYRTFRFTQWERWNMERIAAMSPAERQERFRSEEMLTRYRAGLPPRDDDEREAYREWRQLDADYVNDYVQEVLIPQRQYETYQGPLSWEEYLAEYRAALHDDDATYDAAAPRDTGSCAGPQELAGESAGPPHGDAGAAGEPGQEIPDADASPGAVRCLPGLMGAGSGLDDGPMIRAAPDGPIPDGEVSPEAGPPWLVPPGDPGPPGQARPRHEQGPGGPVPW